MTLCQRSFFDVRLSARGIKNPSLKSRAGTIRNRLVQLRRVIIGGSRAIAKPTTSVGTTQFRQLMSTAERLFVGSNAFDMALL